MSASSIFKKMAELKPSLPVNTYIQPRQYRDEQWFVLHDKVSGRFHRFNESANKVLACMDGNKSLQDIYQICNDEQALQEEEQISEADIVELVQYLYVADLLVCDFTANTQELFQRSQQKKQQFWAQLVKNPIAWKFKLFNPDAILDRCLPFAKLLSSKFMASIWLLVVSMGVVQAVVHWPRLVSHTNAEIFSPANLFLIWLIYPFLKIVHECGHALLTKVWGGRVYECGIVFIMGTPLPFVDASSATGFPERWQRMMVSAAGVMVELFIASIALFLWLYVDAGLLSNILFNIVLIGSVSTLFFNGNPLMRFDGYHFLCDAFSQPNLASRAQLQLVYVIKYYLYGINSSRSQARSRKEAVGLTVYAVLAFLYRLVILATIVFLALNYFPIFGFILGCWLVFFQFLLPLFKSLIFVLIDKDSADTRWRGVLVSAGIFLVLVWLVFFMPISHSTRAEAVLWLPEDVQVRAVVSGKVADIYFSDGELVSRGQHLIQLVNPAMQSRLALQQAKLREYQLRSEQAWSQDYSQVRLFEQELQSIQAEIELLRYKVDNLLIRSNGNGRISLLGTEPLAGRFLQEGDVIGLLINDLRPWLRTVVRQDEIALVSADTQRIEVKLSSAATKTYSGRIIQQVPQASYKLPSPILGTANGGRIVLDAKGPQGDLAMDKVFVFDVDINEPVQLTHYGQRVWVTFHHSAQPLAYRVAEFVHQELIRLQPQS